MTSAPGRLTVAVISSVHRWNDTRIFVKQAATLAGAGFDVVLMAPCDHSVPFETSGVRVVPLRRRSRASRWLTWLAIVRLVLVHRPSVVHAHDPELIPIALLLRLVGCKVVCDVHENLAEQVLYKEWIPGRLRRPLSRVLKSVQWLLPTLFDAVVLAEDSYVRDFPAKPNVFVVRNFPVVPVEHKLEYQTEVLRLVYVGDVRKVRGISEYVEITARLHNQGVPVLLRVIGSFADRAEEQQIAERLRRLGLTHRVEFLGRRPPEEIPALLADCDVGLALLHPIGNYRDSYPTKMFEYMAAGLPVVASRFALWEEVLVGNDCGRVVDPVNVNEGAAAAGDYWASRELRECHGRHGRGAVLERYSWDAEAARLLRIYAGLVGQPARTPG